LNFQRLFFFLKKLKEIYFLGNFFKKMMFNNSENCLFNSLIIHNICISEFHDFVGKQIICQYPKEYLNCIHHIIKKFFSVISTEDFHNLGSFFITKEDLYGKLIALYKINF